MRDYLVRSGGIATSQINVAGKGESSPVTLTAQCKGTRPNAKLIACLQAYRRVEIEVCGTR